MSFSKICLFSGPLYFVIATTRTKSVTRHATEYNSCARLSVFVAAYRTDFPQLSLIVC